MLALLTKGLEKEKANTFIVKALSLRVRGKKIKRSKES